ncbi:MAG: F0F1 ATP synthase subunit gamma [Rhodobacteraceae bacterium]|nr:F0F1 ATP synthase subunit gamma [Paracoccaceae bacterium]
MSKLTDIETHISNVAELLNIITAMRSLAGMRMQEAQSALSGIRNYAQDMADAIGAMVPLLAGGSETSEDSRGRAFIVFMSEHGFVGGYNERLIEHIGRIAHNNDHVFAIGTRGAAQLSEHGRPPQWSQSAATRVVGAPDSVDALGDELYRRIAAHEFTAVDLVYHRYRRDGHGTIERVPLLPLDVAALASKTDKRKPEPMFNIAPGRLVEGLASEYVFALLTEAAVEAIASENDSRFAVMSSAHDNVMRKLSELRQLARSARQDDITSDLLDLITGAEAQINGYRRRRPGAKSGVGRR